MFKSLLKKHLSEIELLVRSLDLENILSLKKKILITKKKKGRVYIFGNGGSSSTANHFAVDMKKNARVETISNSNDNLITCLSNDYAFNSWIKNVLKFYTKKNDLIIFLSVSGEFKNIINALKYCKLKKLSHSSLTGLKKNNTVNKISKDFLWVDSISYIVDLIIGKSIYSSDR